MTYQPGVAKEPPHAFSGRTEFGLEVCRFCKTYRDWAGVECNKNRFREKWIVLVVGIGLAFLFAQLANWSGYIVFGLMAYLSFMTALYGWFAGVLSGN